MINLKSCRCCTGNGIYCGSYSGGFIFSVNFSGRQYFSRDWSR